LGEDEVEAQLTVLFARMGAAGRDEAVDAASRRGLLSADAEIVDTALAIDI
jgi:hypothetical protein